MNRKVERPCKQGRGRVNVERKRKYEGVEGELLGKKNSGNEHSFLEERDVEKGIVVLIWYIVLTGEDRKAPGICGDTNGVLGQVEREERQRQNNIR